ncbi:cytochrome c maturation protein CcmE [Sphingomonas sp. HMWF008]|uniref:cytochrome c maturation protein CcmE n=1 Tax=Sphingomonas sp. MMS24-J45 TaxID=3238806 RepID=UPI000D4BB590|nr:cytochrome c maturation protein CcmE [Sphingomonas sp. HMWF008]
MKAKHQRLTLGILAVVAVGGASVLALSALKDQAAFFYAPSDVKKEGLPLGRAVRLGGMVAAQSIQRMPDGVSMRFVVTDGLATVPVAFRGIAPDLFREKSGVVAEGSFNPDGSFTATNLLAKHDEKYMPPEMAGKMHETKSLKQ